MLVILGLEYYAYVGILSSAESHRSDDKALVGGQSLDLLAFTFLVQFATLLWSEKFYWLLVLVPVWGGYVLYDTFASGTSDATGIAGDQQSNSDAASASNRPGTDKREKRATKRRQKWS